MKVKEQKRVEFQGDLENITEFVSSIDPTIGSPVSTVVLDNIKAVIDKWADEHIGKRKNRYKDEILSALSNMHILFNSDSYFHQNDTYKQIIKDETRTNWKKASEIIFNSRYKYRQYYLLLFIEDKVKKLEDPVFNAIYNALRAREHYSERLKGLSEEQFRDDVYDVISSDLRHYNITVRREERMGYSKESGFQVAKKKTGEADLVIKLEERENLVLELAVGEVKIWNGKKSFVSQLQQLTQYKHTSVPYAFNIIFNRDRKLVEVSELVKEVLEELKSGSSHGIPKVIEFGESYDKVQTIVSTHYDIDSGKEFKIYHFIANVVCK
ncbi:hypothetical protein ACFC4S_23265 [Priestia megaterium]|uniref:hypothetical protein n=1 Tax=Priestia megaterium TaxID=1404 RepID=UPI0035D89421